MPHKAGLVCVCLYSQQPGDKGKKIKDLRSSTYRLSLSQPRLQETLFLLFCFVLKWEWGKK